MTRPRSRQVRQPFPIFEEGLAAWPPSASIKQHLRSGQAVGTALFCAAKVSRLKWTSGCCLKGSSALLCCAVALCCLLALRCGVRLCVALRRGDVSQFSQYDAFESPSGGAKRVTHLIEPFMQQSIHTALPSTNQFTRHSHQPLTSRPARLCSSLSAAARLPSPQVRD